MRIEIIGRLGHSAETKAIKGRDYLSFDIAPSQGRDAGDTMWVSCLYGNTRVAEWLTKGRQVFVRGDYRDRIYTKRDGTAAIDRSVMVTELELLGERGDGGQRDSGRADTASAQGYSRQPAQQPRYSAPQDDDDDLPF